MRLRITGALKALSPGPAPVAAVCRREFWEQLMTTTKAMWLASVVTAINVLVASGFSIVAIIHPQYLVPAGFVPTQASLILAIYAAARTISLALFALWAIYKQAAPALVLLGALAGAVQLLDAGIGLFEHDLGKCVGRSLSLSSNSSWCMCFTDHATNQARIRSVPSVNSAD